MDLAYFLPFFARQMMIRIFILLVPNKDNTIHQKREAIRPPFLFDMLKSVNYFTSQVSLVIKSSWKL